MFSWKKYLVEFLGTFALCLVVVMLVTSSASSILVAILAGFVVCMFVYTIGHISGAHLNPAITIGAFMINKITWKDGLFYILAQFIGAGIAMAIALAFIPEPGFISIFKQLGTATGNTLSIGIAEAIGMFFFSFGVASVIYGKVKKGARGFVAGGSLFLGTLLAIMLGSAGILNPAVALTINSFNALYIMGPIVGSIAGMWIYTILETEDLFKKTAQVREENSEVFEINI